MMGKVGTDNKGIEREWIKRKGNGWVDGLFTALLHTYL